MNHEISVIIATRNEQDTIGSLVESIKTQNYPPKEIIVVDGDSKDLTRDIARAAGAKVIPETGENRSPSNAWNIGAQLAKGDVICFLGGDFLLENKRFFEEAIRPFEEIDVVAVSANALPVTNTFFKKITAISGKSIQPMLIQTKIFKDVGGYPMAGFGEEMILVNRLHKYCKKYDKKMQYAKDAFFGGHPVGSLVELFWQGEWYGRTSFPFLRIYKKESGMMGFLKQTILMNLRTVYSLSIFPLIYSIYFGAAIWGLPFLILFAHTIVKNLTNPPRVLKVFTNFAYGYGYLYGVLRYAFGINRGLGRK